MDLVCFSHLRWRFVYQRPQHVLSRASARVDRVFFVEEPQYEDLAQAEYLVQRESNEITVLTPVLPREYNPAALIETQRSLIHRFFAEQKVREFIAWYYTPMALLFTHDLKPALTVYDCMDELSAFRGAPPELLQMEARLFEQADVVFTGGRSLYEAKKTQHRNISAFPSSVDIQHFGAARLKAGLTARDPEDQAGIPHPRIGFFGVLDERLDRDLLREIAACEPAWQFVLVGPVVKIDEEQLPRAENIHYLGSKEYRDLPAYLAHWDVAMLPFALNESTRFISPTKTPEYLAGGKPVVSTPIHDVRVPYEDLGLARIAETPKEFCTAIAASLEPPSVEWLAKVDAFLQDTSWDKTFEGMWGEVERALTSAQRNARGEVLPNV